MDKATRAIAYFVSQIVTTFQLASSLWTNLTRKYILNKAAIQALCGVSSLLCLFFLVDSMEIGTHSRPVPNTTTAPTFRFKDSCNCITGTNGKTRRPISNANPTAAMGVASRAESRDALETRCLSQAPSRPGVSNTNCVMLVAP